MNLIRKLRGGELKKLHLARRFHANPLVIPKMVWLGRVPKEMKKGKLPVKLVNLIQKQKADKFSSFTLFSRY